jgi:hypothetical protein
MPAGPGQIRKPLNRNVCDSGYDVLCIHKGTVLGSLLLALSFAPLSYMTNVDLRNCCLGPTLPHVGQTLVVVYCMHVPYDDLQPEAA